MNGWIRIGTKLETKSFDSQINKLEQDADTISKTLESDLEIPVKFRMSKEERAKLESDLESIKNRIISLKDQKIKIETDRSGTKDAKKGFEDLIKSAKRLVGGIIGISAAYSLVRKASSAWLSNDETLTSQMEANWIGLGAIFSDVIETVVKGMKKLVTAVLYFMQILTGTNYIAKANAALLKKQTKETNGLAKANDKLTASFDEMNIVQDTSTGGGVSSGGIDTSALFDVNDLSQSTIETIEKLGRALKPVYDTIKDIIDFAEEHPDVVLAIIGGATLLSMLGKVIGVAGTGTAVGTGLAGLYGVLLAIASLAVITISIIVIYNSIKEAREEFEKLAKARKDYIDGSKQHTDEYIEYLRTVGREEIEANIKGWINKTSALRENTKELLNQREQIALTHPLLSKLTGETDANSDALYMNSQDLYNNTQKLYALYEQGKLTDDEIEGLKETMNLFTNIVDISNGSISDLSKTFNLNEEDAKKLKEQYNKVKDMTNGLGAETYKSKDYFDKFTKSLSDSKVQSDEATRKLKDVREVMSDLRKNDSATLKVNAETSGARNAFNNLFSGLTSKLGTVFGIQLPTIRLAKGGIINNPGRGVPIGGAIAGERGIEGVIPLTDSQQMALLGEAIGKYININATIPIQVGNRQVARELKRISAEDDFAYNR